jgi:small subunit ribosomal protein S17
MAERNNRKTVVGKVTSDRMEKSAVVIVERRFRHALYKKYVTKSTKYLIHDEENVCRVGDKVRIQETRPLSRRKKWRLVEVMEKAK